VACVGVEEDMALDENDKDKQFMFNFEDENLADDQ
jgi:hypothetical protein